MSLLRNPRIAFAVALSLLALSGLGAFALAAPGEADDGVYAVAMDDGAVTPEADALSAGRQVIEVANIGSREHEVVVLRTAKAPDALALGLHGVSIEQSGELVVGEDHAKLGHAHKPGTVLGLLPGEQKRFAVELGPGHYVVYCQTDNHYLAGERAEFTVE